MEFVKNPYAKHEDKADLEIPPEIRQIYDGINSEERKQGTANRCSSATMCVKRNWYQNRGEEGLPLTPRKLINFTLGDLSEAVLQTYIKKYCVGPGKLYSEVDFGKETGTFKLGGTEITTYEQEELHFHLPSGIKITGHIDGLGKRNSDGKWEHMEDKSAANWGFKSFQAEGAKDYKKQSHACKMTTKLVDMGVKDTRFFYLRKETGHLWSHLEKFDDSLAFEVVENFEKANLEEAPKDPHPLVEETYRRKGTGRMVAGFPCTYCPYIEKCKGSYKMEWKKDQWGYSKPVMLFGEKVEEETCNS